MPQEYTGQSKKGLLQPWTISKLLFINVHIHKWFLRTADLCFRSMLSASFHKEWCPQVFASKAMKYKLLESRLSHENFPNSVCRAMTCDLLRRCYLFRVCWRVSESQVGLGISSRNKLFSDGIRCDSVRRYSFLSRKLKCSVELSFQNDEQKY